MHLFLWCFFMVKNCWGWDFHLVLMHMHLFLWCFLWLKIIKNLQNGYTWEWWKFFVWVIKKLSQGTSKHTADKIFFSKQHFIYNRFLNQPNQSIDSRSFQNPYTNTCNSLETTHITRCLSYECQGVICTYYKNSVYWVSLSPVGILYHLNGSQLAKQFKYLQVFQV